METRRAAGRLSIRTVATNAEVGSSALRSGPLVHENCLRLIRDMVLDVKAVTSAEARQRKLDIGAVVEIPTTSGFGYVQYTHWNELMGAKFRVLPGFISHGPATSKPSSTSPRST